MTTATIGRPQRWDVPFGPEMTDADVERLLARPELSAIETVRFPHHTPLSGILRNDARIVRFSAGDLIVREGDYGSSAFLILSGRLRVVLAPGLPEDMLGRRVGRRKNFLEALAQLWQNRSIPEVRDLRRYERKDVRTSADAAQTRVFLQDIPAVLNQNRTALLEEGALFGELAALGRIPRTATVFAEVDSELLEIRWQGLREIRKYDPGWRRMIDERYRENALKVHLSETPLFKHLDPAIVARVADQTLFETYGIFDWNMSYKKLRQQGKLDIQSEPLIARQGEYPDGLLMIRAGFARISLHFGHGDRTLTYLGAGDYYGLDELYDGWKGNRTVALRTSLTALGYVDVLRVPSQVLEEYIFPTMLPPRPLLQEAARPLAEDAFLEWVVEERFVNGTQAMLIDLNKCVRCDDCVRACASTHGGNPRFIRHGKTFDHWMVTNACMHCADPVCLIGCPTGAIHRSLEGGTVIINDDTCVGCATCANSCPYQNIRMVDIRDQSGAVVMDREQGKPIQKATKCDLCAEQLGGPACVRACPHDALRRVNFQDIALLTKGEA